MKRNKTFAIIVFFTFFMLYAGLWSELAGRFKFNQWDIIGAKGRVTNHNLYSNIYIIGIVVILVIPYFIKLIRRYKSN